ncbi:hypothetical protein GCM10022240_25930 [Microbacterium kribbense]|uniref:RES domain-containing protein n=1 Tax=Microbacterium kribbense TaxID=433645 RepID=A0ABP7GPS9_9MICO
MTQPDLEIESSDDLGGVWRVGFGPDMWAWTPWSYADDAGRFSGRWDDQSGEFRTLYTADSLLGCFLELLAQFRPSRSLLNELDQIEDDDGSVEKFHEAAIGAVGYRWVENRQFGSARQTGRYCYTTHSRTIAALIAHYPFADHGLAARDVDSALLKEARDRVLTRSIARWLFNLSDNGDDLVDGVRFNSRHGDEIHMWALFERPDDPPRSPKLEPTSEPTQVTPELSELQEVFRRFGLHWDES